METTFIHFYKYKKWKLKKAFVNILCGKKRKEASTIYKYISIL